MIFLVCLYYILYTLKPRSSLLSAAHLAPSRSGQHRALFLFRALSLTRESPARARSLSLPANNLPSRKSTRCSSLHTDRSKEVRGPEISDFPYGKFRTNSGFFQNFQIRPHVTCVPIRSPDDSSSNATFFVPHAKPRTFRRKIFS